MTRVIGAGAWLLAAVLAILGSFATLVTTLEAGEAEYSASSWTQQQLRFATQPIPSDPLGIVLVVCAVLLLVAAVLWLSPARAQLGRLIGIYGTGAICAATAVLFMLFRVFAQEGLPPGFTTEVGPAAWLLAGGSVLAIAGLVLALIPRKEQ